MPELPEVETVARDLQRWVAGATITDAEVRWERTIRHPQPSDRFVGELRGATIRRVGRRAKSVLLHLADGRVMTVALRMTGALIVAPPGTPDDRYARVVFRLADGRELRYRDVRKFGRIGLWERGGVPRGSRAKVRKRGVAERREPYRVGDVFARHGPEPLARSFSAERFAARLEGTLRAAEDPPPRPVVHRRGRQHLRRRGALAGAPPPAARRGHAHAGRGPAAASRDPRRPATGDRQPRHQLRRLRGRGRRAGRQRRAALRLPAHRAAVPALRARDRSGSWSGSAARTSARAARRCPRRGVRA